MRDVGAERHPQPLPTPWAPGPPGRRTQARLKNVQNNIENFKIL